MNNHQSLTRSLQEAQVRTAFEAVYDVLEMRETEEKSLSSQLFYSRLANALRAARKTYYKVNRRYFRPPTVKLLELAREAESRLLEEDIEILETQSILDAIAALRNGESWLSRFRPLLLIPGLMISGVGILGLIHFVDVNSEIAALFGTLCILGLTGCFIFIIILVDNSF